MYCRAEHEVGERWIVMAIRYLDEYACVDGAWYFSRRREQHWYAADVTERPQAVGFTAGPGPRRTRTPAAFPSWAAFWKETT